MPDQGTRWGVAIPAGGGAMRVERFADREHAAAAAGVCPLVRTRYVHPRRGAANFGEVSPLVHSDDGCASWRYSATGWAVPIETHR